MLRAGWDVGGAHLKLALAEGSGLERVLQLPCPLWQGMARLDEALDAAFSHCGPGLAQARHRVTMTGELVDFFPDRTSGVRAIVEHLARRLGAGALALYGGSAGLLQPADAARQPQSVASANWLATATVLGRRLPEALLVDIGSTTSDLVPIRQGRPAHQGLSDAERLAAGELLYTGVVRTPVMALGTEAPFAGRWHALAAEFFATLADVHRLTGELPEEADLHPTADGQPKGRAESARRLARMLGLDAESASPAAWETLARYFAGVQRQQLWRSLARLRSGAPEASPLLVGAGCGRFVARRLAAESGLEYLDFADALGIEGPWRDAAACCAPAVALALLDAL